MEQSIKLSYLESAADLEKIRHTFNCTHTHEGLEQHPGVHTTTQKNKRGCCPQQFVTSLIPPYRQYSAPLGKLQGVVIEVDWI